MEHLPDDRRPGGDARGLRRGDHPAIRRLALVLLAAFCVAAAAKASSDHTAARPAGKLAIVSWHGLLENEWVKPFEKATGCKVQATYAGSSNELVADLRSGKFDVGAASADVGRALIDVKAVAPLDLKLVPAVRTFLPAFRAPESTTVGGKTYGVAIHWAPNVLLYNTKQVRPKPVSWGTIYSGRFKGKVAVPNDPMQIADAALYLKTAQPTLRIRDPFELTTQQFNAAVVLLQHQKPLVTAYWDYPSDEVQAFRDGKAVIGVAWPWQTATLEAAKVPVAEARPREGTTGWIDSWMLAAKAKNRTCAYRWFQYTSTPSVQAEIARAYGAAPVSAAACAVMEHSRKGSCAELRGNATPAFLRSVHFWKTPLADCGAGGAKRCVDYADWQRAWIRIQG